MKTLTITDPAQAPAVPPVYAHCWPGWEIQGGQKDGQRLAAGLPSYCGLPSSLAPMTPVEEDTGHPKCPACLKALSLLSP